MTDPTQTPATVHSPVAVAGPHSDPDTTSLVPGAGNGGGASGRGSLGAAAAGPDPRLVRAAQVVISRQAATQRILCNRLGVGHRTAADLLDALEANGVVGPMRPGGGREVLVARSRSREAIEALS